MPTSYTSLLGFALPVTGEINGTWGNVVNDSITQLVEDSVAGQATASVASGDWTLTTTGSGAANQARCAILIPTGSPGTTRNIIAPSSSKAYIVDNQSDSIVVLKGSATTGVSIAASSKALCAWNGTDFVQVGGGGGGVYDVQTFTSSGTWTKPAGVSQVRVIAIGGGGGGGSGRKGASGSSRAGGSGGYMGAYSDIIFDASAISSSVSVTIGTGAAGAASQTTNSTNGIAGTQGGNTTFGTYAVANGGFGGGAGSNSTTIIPVVTSNTGFEFNPTHKNTSTMYYMYTLNQIYHSGISGNTQLGGWYGLKGPGGGGGGGTIGTGNIILNVGFGGYGATNLNGGFAGGTASATDGVSGGNGTAATTGQPYGGGGGGGGQASLTGNAGAGGNGALYGGGGGGGGASVDSVGNSGAGGNGADGICVVISW